MTDGPFLYALGLLASRRQDGHLMQEHSSWATLGTDSLNAELAGLRQLEIDWPVADGWEHDVAVYRIDDRGLALYVKVKGLKAPRGGVVDEG